jgi:hypothetical protein
VIRGRSADAAPTTTWACGREVGHARAPFLAQGGVSRDSALNARIPGSREVPGRPARGVDDAFGPQVDAPLDGVFTCPAWQSPNSQF